MRPGILLAVIPALVLVVSACEPTPPLDPQPEPSLTASPDQVAAQRSGVPFEATSNLYWFAGLFEEPPVFEEVEGARGGLTRTSDALMTRTHTAELPHGHVVTLWWIIFNNPDECNEGAGPPCGLPDLFAPAVQPACPFADGSIVGGDGGARFQNWITVGEELRDSCLPPLGSPAPEVGLLNPEGAGVHLVVRSHGPRVPGFVHEQRSSFGGGCETDLPPVRDPNAVGELECSDIQFAVFPPPLGD